MKKAFTLVEMLIVIVIIGILAAALLPRLSGVQSRARDVARVSDLGQLSTALATYQLDNGFYLMTGGSSTTTSGTVALGEQSQLSGFAAFGNTSTRLVNNSLATLVYLGILKELPVEQQTLTIPYIYSYYSSGEIFSLMSYSEGGGKNANFASGYTAIGTTGSISLLVNITSKLCTEIKDSASLVYNGGGSACQAPLNQKTARHILAN
jgi:prepilin-type N-terminal cleavage/methylation domain-containing protein